MDALPLLESGCCFLALPRTSSHLCKGIEKELLPLLDCNTDILPQMSSVFQNRRKQWKEEEKAFQEICLAGGF